jgi:immune inhibitor A
MANVNFSNLGVVQTFTSPHSMNAWGLLSTQPYRKVQPISTDGTTNMFVILCAARSSGRTVSGSYDDVTGLLNTLYLN